MDLECDHEKINKQLILASENLKKTLDKATDLYNGIISTFVTCGFSLNKWALERRFSDI